MNTTIENPTTNNKAEQRREKAYQRKIEKKIEQAKAQKPIKSITITIEWKNSRVWGMNPHAEGRVCFKDGTATIGTAKASGCGYCKRSTVIADIFNQFLAYKLHDKAIMDKLPRPYGITTPRQGETNFAPYYEGGIGEGCYRDISKYIGGTWECVAHSKNFEVFRYTESV